MGRLSGEPLDNMLNVCAYFQHAIGARARIPLYLIQKWGAQPPTGESLKKQESALVAKITRKQYDFGDSWRRVFELSLKLEQTFGEADIPADLPTLRPVWAKPYSATAQELKTEAEAKRDAGVPEEQILQEVWGYSAEQAAQFVTSQQARKQAVMGQALQALVGNGKD